MVLMVGQIALPVNRFLVVGRSQQPADHRRCRFAGFCHALFQRAGGVGLQD